MQFLRCQETLIGLKCWLKSEEKTVFWTAPIRAILSMFSFLPSKYLSIYDIDFFQKQMTLIIFWVSDKHGNVNRGLTGRRGMYTIHNAKLLLLLLLLPLCTPYSKFTTKLLLLPSSTMYITIVHHIVHPHVHHPQSTSKLLLLPLLPSTMCNVIFMF